MLHTSLASSQHHTLALPHLTHINAHVAAALDSCKGEVLVPRQMGPWGTKGVCVCLLTSATHAHVCSAP